MAECTTCGATGQRDRFCVNCGAAISADQSAETAQNYPVPPPSLTDTGLQSGGADTAQWGLVHPPADDQRPPPFAQQPQFPAGPAGPPAKPASAISRNRGWLIVASVFVTVLALGTAALLILQPWSNKTNDQAVIGSGLPSTAAPPASATASNGSQQSSASVPDTTAAAPTATVTVVVPAEPVPPAPVTTTVQADPMGGPNVPIGCGSGYIVQVASELDTATFSGRVAELRSSGTLPTGTKWADTGSSCSIFTTQSNVLVLYAGPFASPYDACPARLASPPDAFIKGTTPDSSSQYISCLCPASAGQLPSVTTVGQQGVWVGELQRVLGSKLDYTIGSINADPAAGDPGRWGIYTAETAAAVGRFQNDNGLAATSQVDGSTWAALQRASC
jgi:peptidoglycan hydrolase-like protein with peptidoglycan-binding domain